MNVGSRVATAAVVSAGIVLLSGCEPGPGAFYLQQDATAGRTRSDITQCEVEAVNTVPAAIVQSVSPIYRTPDRTTCRETALGIHCTTMPGMTYGGNVSTIDRNEDLRSRVLNQCMASRGYDLVTLPHCNDEQLAAGRFYPDAIPKPPPSSLDCWSSAGGFIDLP